MKSELEAGLLVFAGLGYYFFGFGLVRAALTQLTSRRVRDFLREASGHPARAALSGFLSGAVTQSSIAMSVILGSMVSRGITTFRKAAPIVAWSNLGLVFFVYFSTVQVHWGAMVIIGVTALMMNFNFFPRYRAFWLPLFGLATALFSMRLMKEGLIILTQHGAFTWVADWAGSFLVIAFLFGAFLRTVIQSNSAVAVIGIILCSSGAFSEHDAMLVIYGSGFGTGTAAFLLTSHLTGGARQIALFEAVINGIAGLFMLLIFGIERVSAIPLVEDLVMATSGSLELRLAEVFLIQQLVCLAVAYAVIRIFPDLFQKWVPLPMDQDLSRVRFIEDRALEIPEIAVDLAKREQLRVLSWLPDMLDSARSVREKTSLAPRATLHAAAVSVDGEIQTYIEEIAKQRLPESSTQRVLRLQQRHGHFIALENTVNKLCDHVHAIRDNADLRTHADRIIEAADLLVITLIEAFQKRDSKEIDMLLEMTSNSSPVMDRIRTLFVERGAGSNSEQRVALLDLFTCYERITWLIRQISFSFASSSEIAVRKR